MTAATEQRQESALHDGERPRLSSVGSRSLTILLGLVGILIALGVAELLVVTRILPEVDIPRMSTILGELASQLGKSSFWSAIWATIKHAGAGLILAVVLGIPIGIGMGAFETFHRALRPTVEFLRVVPGLALLPLAQVIWGPSNSSVVFVVAFGCLWVMLVQTMHGIQSIDSLALVTARSFRIGGVERVRSIYVPGSMPYVLTGLRIAVAVSLIASIGTELIIGAPGLGTQIRDAQSLLHLPEMYAFVIAAGAIGLMGALVTDLLERVMLRWRRAGG